MKMRGVWIVEQKRQSMDGPVWLVVSRHEREFAAMRAADALRGGNGCRLDVRVVFAVEGPAE
jgi:hypothetical protein